MNAAGNKIIACSLRCGFGKIRRFDLGKAVVIEIASGHARDLMAKTQVFLHLLAADIEKTIFQAKILTDIFCVLQLKRQRFGFRQKFKAVSRKLHRTGLDFWINGIFASQPDLAANRYNILIL